MKDILYPKKDLFTVDGELVDRYNSALEMVIGRRTELTNFNIDKRGESMEIEEELGKNYLQNGPSNRYAIIVSPNQSNAPLVHEEFSFDNELLDFLYENYGSEIGIVSRVDSLVGELDDGLRFIKSVTDLSLLHKVSCSLDTPSGFLDKARNLQKAVSELEKDPHLLTKKDSLHIKKIQSLVREVGDVRGYNFHEISVSRDIGSFYSRLFDGAYVFRNESKPISMHAPGTMNVQDLLEDDKTRTTVIVGNDSDVESNEFVQFYQLGNKEDVLHFLFHNKYAVVSFNSIEERLCELEDQFLIGLNHDVVGMPLHERKRLLSQNGSSLPSIWDELHSTHNAMRQGYDHQYLANNLSTQALTLLVEPSKNERIDTKIIHNLLTKLNPIDYISMRKYNPRSLENIYEESGSLMKRYIGSKIRAVL